MHITKEIGGLEQSMKKKNDVIISADEIDEIEEVEITSNDVEVPQRKGFFSKKEKNKGFHITKNELSTGAKKSMATRLISALVGMAIVVPAIFLGDWIYFGVVTLAMAIACYEILGCTNKRTAATVIVYFLFVALIAYWPIFKTLIANGGEISKIDSYYDRIYLPIIPLTVGLFLVFFLTVIYKDFTVHDACFLIAMTLLVGLGFQCLFYLRYSLIKTFNIPDMEAWTFTVENTVKPSLLLVFVIVSTFLTDSGAYFVGIFFGKNKINERISPKKTWEGFVGGVVISFVLSASIGIVLAKYYPIHPMLTLEKGWYWILILSLLIPLFATLGDFVFSSIKRYWGIKDYGKLIPGHGGVLDRLDSIIFAVIITSIFIFMLSTITDGELSWKDFLV